MSETAISVNHLTKIYKLYDKPIDRLKESLGLTRKKKYREHYALRDVSFSVGKGETVGIIGTNGSGKSTILKIITGVLNPSQGEVTVNGRISALLELGAGFNSEYSGLENVYLNGSMIGYTKAFLDEKYEEIVRFAQLEGFMEEKVRNYSSGMVSRLGFSIATIQDTPEILILDEVLSVGDLFFRKKSEARIKEMIHGGSTVLLVSHSTAVIRSNCTRAIWIEKGRLRAMGDPDQVCRAYENMEDGL